MTIGLINTGGNRTYQRLSAPVSIAVFLCLSKGITPPTIYGRAERRNTIPRSGNRPGASDKALFEARPPRNAWWPLLNKTYQEGISMPAHPCPSCAHRAPPDLILSKPINHTLCFNVYGGGAWRFN